MAADIKTISQAFRAYRGLCEYIEWSGRFTGEGQALLAYIRDCLSRDTGIPALEIQVCAFEDVCRRLSRLPAEASGDLRS